MLQLFSFYGKLALYCGFCGCRHLDTAQKQIGISSFSHLTIAILQRSLVDCRFVKYVIIYDSMYVWQCVCVIRNQSYKFDVGTDKLITGSVKKVSLHLLVRMINGSVSFFCNLIISLN